MNRSMFWDHNIDIEGFIFLICSSKRVALVLLGTIRVECY
jgi:hypothetical protein